MHTEKEVHTAMCILLYSFFNLVLFRHFKSPICAGCLGFGQSCGFCFPLLYFLLDTLFKSLLLRHVTAAQPSISGFGDSQVKRCLAVSSNKTKFC